MLKIKLILVTLGFSIFATYAYCGEENKTREILVNACKFTAGASFKSNNLKWDDEETKFTIYRMVTPDNILLERREDPRGTTLTNKDGIFCWRKDSEGTVVGNMVIKTPSQWGKNIYRFLCVASYYDSYNIGSYSISEENRNEIPCYRIEVKLPTDDATLAKLAKITLEQLNKERDDVKTRSLAAMTFWVGKEKPFIYACAYYNLYGKKIIAMDWGTVDLSSPIDKNIFKLPEHVSIQVVNNYEELHKIMEQYYAPGKWHKK